MEKLTQRFARPADDGMADGAGVEEVPTIPISVCGGLLFATVCCFHIRSQYCFSTGWLRPLSSEGDSFYVSPGLDRRSTATAKPYAERAGTADGIGSM